MSQRVLLCVNSDIGRGNTIGIRFTHVARQLKQQGNIPTIFARSNSAADLDVHTLWYGAWYGKITRALRTKVFPSLKTRAQEMALFDRQALRFVKQQEAFAIAHIGEYIPQTIAYLQSQGTKVILDIPIGFDDYLYDLQQQGIYHGTDVSKTVPMVYQAVELADVITVPSNFVASLVQERYPEKTVHVIPFGVDVSNIPSVEDLTAKQQSVTAAAFVGNVSHRKGIPDLLSVWQDREVPLLMAGRVYKDMKPILAAAPEQVEVLGFVPANTVYDKAQVFILPSYMEGSAKVIYEAMAHGLVVITTPQAGSIIEDNKTGILVPAGDRDALKQAITTVLQDNALRVRLVTQAAETIASYSWEHYAQSVISTYEV